MRNELSFAVVGARFENPRRKGRPTGKRESEIMMLAPGDPVLLEAEPTNPADQNAIAVYSQHGVQMGYIPADRTYLVRRAWEDGKTVIAIFQWPIARGAVIRVSFDGQQPTLPPPPEPEPQPDEFVDAEPDFYPDPVWED